jgi:hypothetical protein
MSNPPPVPLPKREGERGPEIAATVSLSPLPKREGNAYIQRMSGSYLPLKAEGRSSQSHAKHIKITPKEYRHRSEDRSC